MKPHMDLKGKGLWANFWGDKVKTRFKRIFSKSERQSAKRMVLKEL